MKGDFSRFSFDPLRHYSRVLLQQGRVQTDADWNEQADIAAHRHAAGLRDLIGSAGAPRDRAGFAIRAHGGLQFDGDQSCIDIRDRHPLRFAGDGYTVEGWVKLAGEGRGMTIVRADHERSGDLPGGFRFGVTRDGRLRFERLEAREVERVEIDEIEIDAWGDVIEEDIVIEIDRIARRRIVGQTRLPAGRFCHVAVVCADGRLRLFVDGTLDAERPAGSGTPFNSSPMLVGCDEGRNGRRHHFAGTMDRLRLWRRALDGDEVRAASQAQMHRGTEHDYRWLLDGHHADRTAAAEGRAERMPQLAAPEIWIGAGRCYVDGLLCENDADVLYHAQPDCPGLALPDRGAPAGRYLAYLDVWERVVSAVEDEGIVEPALGGPDTAARLRIVAQVRLVPLEEGAEPRVPSRRRSGSLRVSRTSGLSLQENLLYRVEIHDPGVAAGGPASPDGGADPGYRIVEIDGHTVTIVLPLGDERAWAAGQQVELARPGNGAPMATTIAEVLAAPPPGRLQLKLHEAPAGGEASGWMLYPIATFKWSRDNGAWAFAVTGIDADGTTLTLADPNRMRDVLQQSDWVEVVDDDMALCGRAAPLCRIAGLEADDLDSLTVVLDRPCGDRPFDQRKNKHPLLRRWDGIDADKPESLGVKPVAADAATTLAGGIHLRFGAGSYAREDYWVVSVREHLAWPVDEKGQARAQAPQGVRHGYAELALVSCTDSRIDVHDLRRIFAPLADAAAPAPAARPSAPDAGGVPVGHSILGPSAQPPPGWRYTGARIALRQADPAWCEHDAQLPQAGPVWAAALDDTILCLMESGELWAFDPHDADAWTACRRLDDPHLAGASVAALDGKLHVVGGHDRDGNASARHRCYDPAADEWRELVPLATPRAHMATAVVGGSLFAAGGSPTSAHHPLDVMESYRPGDDAWTMRTPVPHRICAAAAGASGGRLYLFGGIVTHLFGLERQATAEVHAYAPGADRWTEAPPLATARSGALVAHADDRLHVVGGNGGDGIAPVEAFAPSSGTWLEAPQPIRPRTHGAVVTLQGTIYLLGGLAADGPTATIETCAVEQVFHVHCREATTR